ncbi:glycoside hydrolase family 25 protein [Marinomonas agarivorans]|nr:glycoside hydrolase family 25 protein [Marinomonas agarivorans]
MKLEMSKKIVLLVGSLLALGALILIQVTASFSGGGSSGESLANQYAKHSGSNEEYLHGIDVSYYQETIDWTEVGATDVTFVYVKATDGMTYTDPQYDANMSALNKQKKLLYGAYHFFEAEDDPLKQANNFITQLSKYAFTLAPMVDVEVTKSQPPQVIQKRLQTFLDAVQSSTGCLPIIYSNKSFWEQNIGPSFDDYVFWLAEYATTMDAPAQVQNLELWQYSESGKVNGITTAVDLDVLLNGREGLNKIRCSDSIKT